ncbi:MAG: bifunctional diguanylate cyclase/phosphodiesterase [Alphaproteobacteria bacterium]|nr:MAG: bifunctional diguanylate cyclase/phosphodiesterase [Alphaproteobacteria bacterium]
MPMPAAQPVLIVSPRYADEVAASVTATGMVPRIERRTERAEERFADEPARLVVVDARGALAPGMVVARALGRAVEKRRGAMLVLLSRADGSATSAAHDAGATGVLVSPFGAAAFGNALRLAARHAGRLDAAARALESDGAAERRHDTLTGLATGDVLQAWIAARLAAPERPQPVYVLAVGVGRFAQINAAYGRAVADRVLSAVALRLSQIVDARSHRGLDGDTRLLGRLAAAEFAVAMAGRLVLADATRLAHGLAAAFERPFVVDDHVIHLSARVGIAASADNDISGDSADSDTDRAETDAAAIIRRASAALALARTGEAGTVEVFQADPGGDPLTRMADLESDLHDAIENGDIALVFQPQMALASGQIAAVEALVRWEHPQLGLLPAETLLETAASAELAIKLGRHIRQRAIAEAARWHGRLARLRLSVNVTAADLADPGFADAVEAALAVSGLARQRLTLEVTEGALIDDMRGAVNLLARLRATGVKVALDDFGTGYSSLAWMARLPIDQIKLDRSFTLGLTGSPRERVVVETVVRLSKQLGLTVVAEGVEDDVQLEATRLAGCDAVQGYQVAPPMQLAALETFCNSWRVAELAG